MKTQILPNWCKKLGLVVFLSGSIPMFILGYMDGIEESMIDLYVRYPYARYAEFLELIGILIYFLSKEKIEDDYIQKLRLESYQITVILGLSLLLLLSVFFENTNVNSKNVVEFFLIVFLLVFYSKKRAE